MDQSSVLIQFEEKILPDIEKRIAQSLSPYSDTTDIGQLSRRVGKGKQAEVLIFISTFFKYWSTDNIIRAIGNKAFQSNYEGIWSQVQECLEQYEANPKWFVEWYLTHHSPSDFFGNFIPKVRKEIRMINFKLAIPKAYELPPVRRKVRRRGYNDKGSMLPNHLYRGEGPSSLKEKVDRRPQIHHPLLEENAGQAYRVEHSILKRGDYNERGSRKQERELWSLERKDRCR